MPRLLDLFCGAGGASVGYHQAGFDEIVGVDINPQRNYPFTFIQADALNPPVRLNAFDLIHASPPCQYHSSITRDKSKWPDLIEPTRALLEDSGTPWIMENVPGAPLVGYLRLCGSMFGLDVQRHRYFEMTFPAMSLACNHKAWNEGRPWTVTGKLDSPLRKGSGKRPHSWKPNIDQAADLMGMPRGMPARAYTEAIPPAYTRFIGEQFLAQQEV